VSSSGDIGFDRFWVAYPRRQAKREAWKAWCALKPSPDLVETIVRSVDAHRAQWDDPRFIPLPATFLRGERWLDEIVTYAERVAITREERERAVQVYRSAGGCRHQPACHSMAECIGVLVRGWRRAERGE